MAKIDDKNKYTSYLKELRNSEGIKKTCLCFTIRYNLTCISNLHVSCESCIHAPQK